MPALAMKGFIQNFLHMKLAWMWMLSVKRLFGDIQEQQSVTSIWFGGSTVMPLCMIL